MGAGTGAAEGVMAGGGATVGCIMLTGDAWALGLPGAGAWIWPSGIWETWAWAARGRRRRAIEGRIFAWFGCLVGCLVDGVLMGLEDVWGV